MGENIAIAGVGVVSALGIGVEATLASLRAGRTGLRAGGSRFSASQFDGVVGEVPHNNKELGEMLGISSKEFISRTALLGMLAAKECLADVTLHMPATRIGFVNGTTVGGMDGSERFYQAYLANETPDYSLLRMHDCGKIQRVIGDYCHIKGYQTSVSTACSSGVNAILVGARLIENEMLDAVLVGGCDALSMFTLSGFRSLRIYSESFCNPFSTLRDGLNLGEGAGYILLCREGLFTRHDDTVYGTYLGGANTNDAYHQTASSPEGDGAYLAMQGALQKAGISSEHVDYLNTHGTGTLVNDESEGKAIRRVMGERLPKLNSTKGYTGHTLGAAGAIEAVFTLLALRYGEVWTSLHAKDSECVLPVTTSLETGLPLHVGMSNSLGFGGNSSCVLFQKG